MNKYLRPAAIVTLLATVFSVQATEATGNKSESHEQKTRSLEVIGLTEDQRLISFNEKSPEKAHSIGTVTGLMSGDMLVGIDYRVQDGKLYGVSKTGGIYMLDTGNASATKVSQLTVAMEGGSFGVDFNPAADRLRVVSDTGQNLRHNINAAGVTLVDDPLDYPPATSLNSIGPNATGVTASAYTNNDLDASTATTLYAIDTNLDQVALQSPPNDGTLAGTGKLGTDATASTGFDIYSTVRDGIAVDVRGLASLREASGASSLYSINLSTGKATRRGSFSNENNMIGIAIPLEQL
ncbi:DUF4394 domain-containing protein [Noviherbaspirillum saxi]|uniref:DUF4394 domain-containing protein n=1 Tax=Noviherbaspirillum saxi TaxID=2320863 RepID=A0A3A3FH38_9BURK|nr:DUF4394 domain-containing protein [Noviherbaspirillum saxi]RJF91814.1 DUF4394 domain-containing protein [Noviherbaspirillum saxi]